VTVALGDVNGDGFADLIVGAATGTAQVKVYDGKALANGTLTAANAETHLLTQFTAYDSRYSVGVNVAASYVNGTTDADIITGAASGNPHVKVFNSQAIANGTFNPANPDASLSAQWFAYGVGLNIGATVAGGDLENDGFADVVTGASTGNPHVKVYSGRAIHNGTFNGGNPDASLVTSFMPYTTGMGLGVNVAVGDVNGDGFADLITGPRTMTPDVRVYDGKAIATGTFNALNPNLQRLDQFFAFDPKYHTGVSLAAADFTGNGRASLLTAASTGAPDYRLVDGLRSTGTLPPSLNGIDATLPGFQGGLFVAG
jgi:serralysin